jgi:hypothetical protein
MINTAMAEHRGVLRVHVFPGTDSNKIVDDSLRAVTGYSPQWLNASDGATRVAKWHKLFFSVPPTILLRVCEISSVDKAANVANAARMLVDTYNLRVVIDAADESCLEQMVHDCLYARFVQVRQLARRRRPVVSISGWVDCSHTLFSSPSTPDALAFPCACRWNPWSVRCSSRCPSCRSCLRR